MKMRHFVRCMIGANIFLFVLMAHMMTTRNTTNLDETRTEYAAR